MVISNYRLPQIERPTEESLDEDDEKILAAFEIVLSGYKRAQKRTRALTKAYNELESLTTRILEDLKSKDRASKGTLAVQKSSTPVRSVSRDDVSHERSIQERRSGGPVEMIDLTALFTQEMNEPNIKRLSGQSRNGSTGNQENTPPSEKRRESRPYAKIGLAKVFNVDEARSTSQRRVRQTTLALKPISRKVELSRNLEKRSPEKRRRLADDNLFDEDYRARKKRESEITPKFERISCLEPEVIPSTSQINETARSIFDDEDNYQASPDILNTCAESSILEAAGEPVAHSIHSPVSVDETFFAPAERQNQAREQLPGGDDDRSPDCAQAADRSSSKETNDEAGELEVLELQDINWDAEVSDDDWNSSAELPPNNSFHLPPNKRKKSPQYAYKEKVERNKEKRSKLRGWDCWECEQYYGKMQLSEEELKKKMDACSRHRGKFNPRYCTPKDFWNPGFPESTNDSDYSQI